MQHMEPRPAEFVLSTLSRSTQEEVSMMRFVTIEKFRKKALIAASILASVGALMSLGLVLAHSDVGPQPEVQLNGSASAQPRS